MKEVYNFRVYEDNAHGRIDASMGKVLGSGLARSVTVKKGTADFTVMEQAIKAAQSEGVSLYAGWDIKRTYTKAELARAEAFKLRVTSVFEPSGEEQGTTYDDENAPCSKCHAGAVQTSPLYLPKSRIPRRKDFCKTIGGEIVVSARVKSAFEENGLTGARFLPVYRNPKVERPYEEWFQLEAEHNDLRVSDQSEFGIAPFKNEGASEFECKAGSVLGLNILSELYVKTGTLGDFDLVFTKEFSGLRSGLLRPERFIVVSQKFRHLYEAEKWKGLELEVAHCSLDRPVGHLFGYSSLSLRAS